MCVSKASGHAGDNGIVSVSAPVFEKEINKKSVQLLDVRTPEEYAEGHIDGAMNIDVLTDEFPAKAEKELSRDSRVFVYCRSGRRSMDAAEILSSLGYRVVNLSGGILEWEENSLPLAR